jgi:hypothetical protein
VPRRLLLPLAALALAGALGAAGCADDVSPAATVGDVTVSDEDLMAEVEAWAGSPTLVQILQVADPASTGSSYSSAFVGDVLEYRIGFEMNNAEFERLGLELTDTDRDDVRANLFQDAAATAAVLSELGAYGDQLVEDVAKSFKLQTELGDDYAAWAAEAYPAADIEVSPRYGTFDLATGLVEPPDGPATPQSADLLVQP